MNLPMSYAWNVLYGAAVVTAAVLAAFVIVDPKQNVSLLFWTVLAALALGRATGQFMRFPSKDELG